tara:strand:- start:680 stop:907 length:228 start_codon:yes stop_codon:yes gene_type:complete
VSRNEAQKNFKEYGIPTNANKPIVVLFIPTSASQVPNVAEVKSSGSPEKNPKGKNIKRFFFRQSFKVFNNFSLFF